MGLQANQETSSRADTSGKLVSSAGIWCDPKPLRALPKQADCFRVRKIIEHGRTPDKVFLAVFLERMCGLLYDDGLAMSDQKLANFGRQIEGRI